MAKRRFALINSPVEEEQIVDGSLYARLADDETITGDWTFDSLTVTGQITGTDFKMSDTTPTISLEETDGTSNERDWTIRANSNIMVFDARLNGGGGSGRHDFIIIRRSGATVTEIEIDTNVEITDGVLYITEQAAADSDISGRGQLFVKNTNPQELWFRDDAGTETQIV